MDLLPLANIRLAVDMKFAIHIHRFSVDIMGISISTDAYRASLATKFFAKNSSARVFIPPGTFL